MADAYVSTSTQSNLVQAAVDRYVRAALRHTPMLRMLADTRPVQVDKPGSSVALYTYSDLAPQTTPLNELTDPDALAIGNPTATTVTLNEYGAATISSIRVRNFAFSEIDRNQADQVAYNMRDSLDVLVRDIVSAGTNVRYSNGKTATNTVNSQDNLASKDARYCVAKLRGAAAQGRIGELYAGYCHPDVAHDLKAETGAGSWRESHVSAAPDLIWPNMIGTYEGVFWVESARMKSAQDGGDGTDSGSNADVVYRTIICGKEALAEAVAIEPHVEIGVVPDKLNRFHPLGWYGLLGWSVFRQASLWRIESGSSISTVV
jgi:N4-gp56 family major capsid protein